MIEWSDKFSVKIKKIDDQHEIFIGLINKLEQLTQKPNFIELLPLVLNEIVEYATLHFKTEENLLAQADYPKLAAHKAIHTSIKKDIYLECKRVVEKEPTAMDVMWLYNYMREWIKTHILEEDMQYVPYLKEFYD